jgi:hypothetical protein
MDKRFALVTIDGAWIEAPEVGMAAGEDLIDSDECWEGHFWEVNFLAVEMEVLVLIAEDKGCDPVVYQ